MDQTSTQQNLVIEKTITKSKNRNNTTGLLKNKNKNSKNNELFIKTAYETNLISYIKVLLGIYKNIPNIIGILDRIIEQNATSILPTNGIYGDSYLQTINQIDRVISLTERKNKLLNLFVIIESMINSLDYNDRKIAILKFTQKNSCGEIAKEINLTERTIFRKINSILEKISIYMLNQNWDTKFLDSQIGNEGWIYESIKQNIKEEKKLK